MIWDVPNSRVVMPRRVFNKNKDTMTYVATRHRLDIDVNGNKKLVTLSFPKGGLLLFNDNMFKKWR